MLAACEVISPVEDKDAAIDSSMPGVGAIADSVAFTATLGGQTKTYLDYNGYSYKTIWSENDRILIWDALSLDDENTEAYEFLSINGGAGTATARFYGTLQAESYVALYASDYAYPVDGKPLIYLSPTQYMRKYDGDYNVGDGCYPMVAVADDRNFEFKNLCSILKVRITGNGEVLQNVRVSAPEGEYVSGAAAIYRNGEDFCLDFLEDSQVYNVYSYTNFVADEELSDEPVDCYIVVPAQTYAGGLEITVTTNEGTRKVSTGKSLTVQRSKFYDISIDFSTELSFLKGTYTANADNYWDGSVTWTISINYTDQSSRKVWFDNLFQKDNWVHSTTRFYGILSDDDKALSIPFGQTSEYLYSNGYPIMLLGFDGENGYDEGFIEAKVIQDGDNLTIDFGDEFGLWFRIDGDGGGNLNVLNPGIRAVKD